MNAVLRPAIVVVVIAPLAVCLFCLRSCRDSTDFRPILQEVRRSEEMQHVQQATLRREYGMRQVAQACIPQRCTLAQAMQRWQELEKELGQEWPLHRDILRQKLAPLPDEQRHYEGIIANVEASLRGQPEKLAAVLSRLEKEYQQLGVGRQKPSAMPTK
jgi:hypothetical protein